VNPVETVLGPRDGSRFDVVNAHDHVWIADAPEGCPRLDDEAVSLAELRDLRAAGGAALIDCQPGGCGRDGRVLRRLMRGSRVAIVASSGFHLRRYYPAGSGPWDKRAAALDLFLAELRDGLVEAPEARAGVVKCAWTGAGGQERELLAAAFEAARLADAPLVVHTERGERVQELCELALAADLSPWRVQLSHVDKRPDPALHLELARAGFMLGYDSFLRPKYRPEEGVWRLLRALLEERLWRHITLGLDLVDIRAWHVRGGPGLRALPGEVLDRLRREGAGTVVLRALAGQNAVRLLAGQSARPVA
jgi:5-phospho-D-xylono-1,4-lactonase